MSYSCSCIIGTFTSSWREKTVHQISAILKEERIYGKWVKLRFFINFRSKDGRLAIGSQPLAYSIFCDRVSLHCQSWTKNHGEKESIQSQRGADCLQLCSCTSVSLDDVRGISAVEVSLLSFFWLLWPSLCLTRCMILSVRRISHGYSELQLSVWISTIYPGWRETK